ncbi:hypothetical protein KCU34_004120 [Vibrio vulnificus]|nr:hypothetical protein [Vibrio vulnificus]
MVSPANTSTHPNYNQIFEKLVINAAPDDKERLIGMLAYADYKEEKYQWKEQYRQSNGVSVVPAQDVQNFLLAYHEDKLNKLRNDAEEILYVFAEHYAEARAEEAYNEALENNLLSEVKNQKDGWVKAAFKGALGSLVFSIFVFLVSIVISFANPDSNYSRLFQFIVGGKEFVILPSNDCRLTPELESCQ